MITRAMRKNGFIVAAFWLGCVVISLLLFVGRGYLIPPKYHELNTISGYIIKNDIGYGVLVKQNNHQEIQLYCDNVRLNLSHHGSRGGGVKHGSCQWVVWKFRHEGWCHNDELSCSNPKFYEGKSVKALINDKKMIYELIINQQVVYEYKQMVEAYRSALYLHLGLFVWLFWIAPPIIVFFDKKFRKS